MLPTVYKSWVRLGDAYRAIQRWQLAHLAYSCAQELCPRDADVQVSAPAHWHEAASRPMPAALCPSHDAFAFVVVAAMHHKCHDKQGNFGLWASIFFW